MKKLATLVVLLALAFTSRADNATQSVLEARPVKKFIRLKLTDNPDSKTVAQKPKVLQYAIDSYDIDDMTTFDGTSFRVEHPVLILLADHNPVTEIYDIKRTRSPDPNHEALKAFMDELEILRKALPDSGALSGGGGTDAERRAAIKTRCDKEYKSDSKRAQCVQETTDCDRFTELTNDAISELKLEPFKAKTFADTINAASGFQGVTDLRTFLSDARTNIADSNARVRKDFKAIREEFGIQPDNSAPPRVCPRITSTQLINYSDLLATAEAIMARKEALSAELLKLHKSLDRYAAASKWRGPSNSLTDYVATSVNPSAEEQEDVAVTVQLHEVTADGANTTVTSALVKDSQADATFPVRRDSFFTIERALAMVYNTLEYPQYGTAKDASGATIVKKNDDHEPINGAVMFNFIPRLGSISGAYPIFQIGFSSAKDYPGLLAGLGIRLVGRFPLSLSVGGMITRYKDLDDTLKEGDPVEGTATINDHLVYKTSPVAIYGAIQVKF